jgi:cellulose synthase/poly-beta-1,6-N-acetylglucosamine synthase-like glycosyltransferase
MALLFEFLLLFLLAYVFHSAVSVPSVAKSALSPTRMLTCHRFLKYFRLLVNCIAYWRYKPVPLSDDPIYTPDDVTVVVPSLDGDNEELRETIRSVLKNEPREVILVTIDANVEKAERLAASIPSKKIRVLSIRKANKRHQMCKALPHVTTPITVFADDDVSWPTALLPWMLSPFKDDRMGGVGTNQRLRRETNPNIWNFLGAAYLIRRNWDCTACTFIDGGLPCLSGRTVAYRTKILQDQDFQHFFTHEEWRSCQLNADDDNFLTRWMVNHNWKTWIQYHKECEVQTTLENNAKYLKQCLRWARSNWRSNIKSLFLERFVWRYVHYPHSSSYMNYLVPNRSRNHASLNTQLANNCVLFTGVIHGVLLPYSKRH